jgi:formylglycine-generating enzyme required for sulfatase activity
VELPPPAEPLDATVEGGVPPEKIREAQAAWAKQLNLPAKFSTPLGNGVNIDWILIPPGRFSMGSSEEQIQKLVQAFPSTQLRFFNNEPLPHPVTIDKPFYLSRTEITRGQFARMVQAKNYRTQMEDDEGGWGWDFQLRGFAGPKPEFSWKETNWKTDDSHPVVNVTWIDAEVMGNWLLDQPTLFPMKVQAIRLPKEVEWEFAARAGTTTLYATGSDDPASLKGIANLADRSLLRAYEKSVVDALDDDDRYPFTAPVGSFPPNAFGLNDLTGNVWEWCRERWGILAPAVSRVPIEPNIGKSEARVIRGGGWQEPPWKCRPGYRLKSEEGTLYIGFRLVLTWE